MKFRAAEKILLDPGFRQAYTPQSKAGDAPVVQAHKSRLRDLKKRQRVTPSQVKVRKVAAPKGLSETELLRLLESHGIGRPATYAGIVEMLIRRKYVERDEDGSLRVTERGQQVHAFLIQTYPEVFCPQYTARLEVALDEIAAGRRSYQAVLAEFWAQLLEHKVNTVNDR